MTTIFEAAKELKSAGAPVNPDFDTAETYDHTDDKIAISSESLPQWIDARPVTPRMDGNVAIFDERRADLTGRPVKRGNMIYVIEVNVNGETKTASVVEVY